MSMNTKLSLKKTTFMENLVKYNGLEKHGFKEWIFYPGMLFNSAHKWWGNGGRRGQVHEGLDLCFYRDEGWGIHSLDKTTTIPMIYDGEIRKIEDDFLGKSIYVRHDLHDDNENVFYSIFGHTRPYDEVERGAFLHEGSILAAISDAQGKKASIPPHLHISLAWIPESFHQELLNWKTISDHKTITLLDPLAVIVSK